MCFGYLKSRINKILLIINRNFKTVTEPQLGEYCILLLTNYRQTIPSKDPIWWIQFNISFSASLRADHMLKNFHQFYQFEYQPDAFNHSCRQCFMVQDNIKTIFIFGVKKCPIYVLRTIHIVKTLSELYNIYWFFYQTNKDRKFLIP